MATLCVHLVAPCVPDVAFASKSVSELDVRPQGTLSGAGLRFHGREVRPWRQGKRPTLAVRAAADGASNNKTSLRAVGIAVEDVDLVVDPPPSAVEYLRVMPDSLQYESGKLGGISSRTRDLEEDELSPTAISYLTRILTSKVYDVAIESPLEPAKKLSERLGVQMLLKREDMQPVFSFKLRGAYNMMAKLPREQLQKGVICSSAGNHAQGVALAARKLGCDAIIAMPVTTPEIKWKSVKRLGATVVLVGDSYDETQAYAKQRGIDEGRVFVPPFDAPDVIAGQGTIGMEIVRQHPGPLHAVFVPVGGGGLIAGIAAYMKQVRPEVSEILCSLIEFFFNSKRLVSLKFQPVSNLC